MPTCSSFKIFDFLKARFFQSIGLGMESSPKISQPKRCKDVQNKILPSTPPIKKLGFLRTAHNKPMATLSYISFTLEQFSVPQTSKLVKSRLVLHCHRIEGIPTGQRGPAFFVRLRSPTHRSQFLILGFLYPPWPRPARPFCAKSVPPRRCRNPWARDTETKENTKAMRPALHQTP